jgi:hypothetical protein
MNFFTISLMLLLFMASAEKFLDDKNEKFIELERHQDGIAPPVPASGKGISS